MTDKKYDWTRDIAGRCMSENSFLSTVDNEQLFVYNDGIYHGDGRAEAGIKSKVDELLENGTVAFPDAESQAEAPNCNTHLLNEVIASVKRQTFISRKELNAEKSKLWLQNGIYNLETGTLEEFSPYIEYHGERKGPKPSTIQLPVTYDPQTDCPLCKKFFEEVMHADDIPVAQEIFGWCLLSDYRFHRSVMLIGGGRNGKSTFLNLLIKFLGEENITGMTLQELDADPFSKSRLFGKLANIFPDLPEKALQGSGIFKAITGGDLRIHANVKFKSGFEFENTAKLLFSANVVPAAQDESDAYFRRWILLTFPNAFDEKKADKTLLKKMTTPEELSGLFNWAVKGLKRLLENDGFSYSKSTDETREEYIRKSSPVAAYCMDCIEANWETWVSKDDIYNEYKAYCQEFNLVVKADNSFFREFKRITPQIREERHRVLGERIQGFSGIAIIPKDEREKNPGQNPNNPDQASNNPDRASNNPDRQEGQNEQKVRVVRDNSNKIIENSPDNPDQSPKMQYNSKSYVVDGQGGQGSSILKLNGQKPHEKDIRKNPDIPGQASSFLRLKFLSDVPLFIGTDMVEYGPFSKNQSAAIPEITAKLLIERKLAEQEASA